MNPSTLLGRDLFRPFATVFVPGAIALSPFMLLVFEAFPKVSEFGKSNPGTASLMLFAASIATGLLLEDIGAQIEWRLLDHLHSWINKGSSDDKGHLPTWDKYLQKVYELGKEPVGQHCEPSDTAGRYCQLEGLSPPGTTIWCDVPDVRPLHLVGVLGRSGLS